LNEDVSCHKFVVRPLHNYGYVLSCHEVWSDWNNRCLIVCVYSL
jgi:hypothetical protein